MKLLPPTAVILVASCILSPLWAGDSDLPKGGDAPAKTFAERADEAVDTLIKTLGGQLKAAIKGAGPEAALSVCKDVAMPLTEGTSEKFEDLSITRVTDKPRNPANTADEADIAALARFRAAMAEGKPLAKLIVPAEGEPARYYRPLMIADVCLKCHGDRDAMSDKLRTLIDASYPEDKAIGYKLGDLRGLIRVERTAAKGE